MADWDQNKPADNDLISQFPSNERDARDAVRTNFGVDHRETDDADVGKHELVELLAQTTPTAVSGQGHFYTKDVGSGQIELFYQDAAGNEIQLTVSGAPGGFESGTKCVFYQASAPTGWTQDTSVNDQVLRTVDGSGGGSGGTGGISGLSTKGHALTVSEMPSHNHGGGSHVHSMDYFSGENIAHTSGNNRVPQETGDSSGSGSSSSAVNSSGTIINSNGGDSAHTHSIDPKYIDVIIATKD